jgi:hypothetical protein
MPRRRRSRLTNLFFGEALESRTMLTAAPFRPPAVPLITSDPYLSIWSESNNLTDTNTVHWTGTTEALVSLIRIDGTSYRLMGDDPTTLSAFPQTSVQVLPTRSIYNFDNGHVHVTMTFMQPALPTDLNALSLPLSYINWEVYSDDGATHSVQIYDSTSSELAVNSYSQVVTWQRGTAGTLTTLDVGTTAQTYFSPVGDQVRIDWGYAYAAASASLSTSSIGYDTTEINTFTANGALTNTDDPDVPRAVSSNQPVMAYAFDLGTVSASVVSRHVIVAYNEIYSIDYFGESLTPYWARNGTTVQQMLSNAETNFSLYQTECAAFDTSLMTDLTGEGGSQYATITALAYRQTFAGMGLAADPNGQPMLFTKEDTSNGDISTVDVIYPTFPQLLFLSPTLAKAALQPIMEYADSSLWTEPYAPHDLGTYPDAIGDPSGNDGNETMPVETVSTMLIMIDLIAKVEHNTEYANKYWSLISSWASYLQPYAYEPGEQLTTNDFLGTLDNSTNLDVKAIIGLGAYANLCQMRGDFTDQATYVALAQADVQHWMTQSTSSSGAQYLFEFGDQGTGVQLYNLVMDQILGTNLFPPSVAASDISYAKSANQTYGVPISSTTARSSLEWSMWEAAMATNLSDFETLVEPMYNYLNTTTVRVPETDIHDDTSNTQSYFHARPVIGGLFIKMLTDPVMWEKYAGQDPDLPLNYAGFTVTTYILPTALESPQYWLYTTTTPANNWYDPNFNTSGWSTGLAGFGTSGTPGIVINTNWNTSNIYMVRTFTMPAGTFSNLQFQLFHDETVSIYINGILAASQSGYITQYETLPINPAAVSQLVAGQPITLAVTCNNTTGGQGVDVGIFNFGPGASPVVQTTNANPAMLIGNSIVLTGTSGNDNFVVSYNSSSATYSFSGGTTLAGSIAASNLSGFSIAGGGGLDTLTIMGNVGAPLLNDISEDGTSFHVEATAGSNFNMASTEHLTSLQIDAGAVAVMQGTDTLVVSALSIAGSSGAWTGQLDVGTSGLIVHNGNLATLTNQVASGFDASDRGSWTGRGITSSAIADDNTHLTALGVIQNSINGAVSGSVLYTSFASQPAINSDVLISRTYYGDANLDGKVDGSDYSRMDAAALTRATGWYNGDFNYDQTVNGSDYALIDNAFNRQGITLAAEVALPMSKTSLNPTQPKRRLTSVPANPGTIQPTSETASTIEVIERLIQSQDILDKLSQAQ